jgi:DNA anti-recombination protein RmuC
MDFTVDIGGLDELGKNLDRTSENIDGATKRLADVGPDAIGPEDLDEACADFRSDWEEGLDKIRDAVEKVRGGIDQTKQAYAELENALRQGMTQMSDDIAASMGGK